MNAAIARLPSCLLFAAAFAITVGGRPPPGGVREIGELQTIGVSSHHRHPVRDAVQLFPGSHCREACFRDA